VLISVSSQAQLDTLRRLPIIAVDMGFSSRTASCGYAFRSGHSSQTVSGNKKFNECLRAVATQISDCKELLLILEAPLSAAFDQPGNPQPRGEFERAPKPRWWSLGAGAAMSLAAMYFLQGIVKTVSAECRCHLIEGFVVGADSGNDADVAETLISCCAGERECSWKSPQSPKLVSVINWVEPHASPAPAPIVLIPTFA